MDVLFLAYGPCAGRGALFYSWCVSDAFSWDDAAAMSGSEAGPLVGVDFSSTSADAVARAWRLAEISQVRHIHVACVGQPDGDAIVLPGDTDSVAVGQAREQVRAFAEGVLGQHIEVTVDPSDAVTLHLLHGAVVDELVALGERLRARTIVIGARGHGRALRLGSVARALARSSPLPVFIEGHRETLRPPSSSSSTRSA